MVRWVVGSILYGGPIELFLLPASAQQIVKQLPFYPVCGMVHIKELLLLIGKSSSCRQSPFKHALWECVCMCVCVCVGVGGTDES